MDDEILSLNGTVLSMNHYRGPDFIALKIISEEKKYILICAVVICPKNIENNTKKKIKTLSNLLFFSVVLSWAAVFIVIIDMKRKHRNFSIVVTHY